MQTVFSSIYKERIKQQRNCLFALVAFLLQPSISDFSRYLGRSFWSGKMMLLGCFLDVIAYIFFLSADNYILLLIATTCFGLGQLFVWYQCESLPIGSRGLKNTKRNPITGKIFKKSPPCRLCFCAFVGDSIYQIQSH